MHSFTFTQIKLIIDQVWLNMQRYATNYINRNCYFYFMIVIFFSIKQYIIDFGIFYKYEKGVSLTKKRRIIIEWYFPSEQSPPLNNFISCIRYK